MSAIEVGAEFGPSSWIDVPQEMIQAFADTTDDHNFIHVDPDMAAQTPFGGTVAHGYLTLSLLPAMSYEVLPHDEPGRRHGAQLRAEPGALPGAGPFRLARARHVPSSTASGEEDWGRAGDDDGDDRVRGRATSPSASQKSSTATTASSTGSQIGYLYTC